MGGMVHEVPVTQARTELADLVNRVVYGGERVVLTRHGKPVVALVPAEDLERLEHPAPVVGEQLAGTRHVTPTPGPTPRRFDIAAEHVRPGDGPPAPSTPGL